MTAPTPPFTATPAPGSPVPATTAAPLPQGRIEGRVAFQAAVRTALAHAQVAGWREIILCDSDFSDWPLAERDVVQSLSAWSKRGRHITLLACHFDHVRAHHARLVTWRKTWSHIIEARACSNADEQDFPSAILTPEWVLQRTDLVRCTGWCGTEVQRRVNLREGVDEWLRRSAPAFPATTLGL